jgi:hypothetical protein
VAQIVVIPLLDATVPLSSAAIDLVRNVSLPLLAGHVVYGVILGLTWSTIVNRRSRPQHPRAADYASRRAALDRGAPRLGRGATSIGGLLGNTERHFVPRGGPSRPGPRKAQARPRSAPGVPGRDERWGFGGHVEAPMSIGAPMSGPPISVNPGPR